MPSTTVIISVGMLIGSMVFGLLFYYVIAPYSKEEKKKQIEVVTTLMINFVIYVWIGKIIVNLSTFIQDPLAILAYPSNSKAFYVATLLIIINLVYRKVRNKERIGEVVHPFIPIFLASSFLFEFFQIVLEGNKGGWLYLTLLTTLIVAYVGIPEQIGTGNKMYILAFSWLIVQLLLSIFAYATIFEYRIQPIYFVTFIIIAIITNVYRNKRKV